MNNFFERLKKEADEIRLTAREREMMRLSLERAIHGRSVKSPVRMIPSPYFFFVLPRQFVAVLVLVLVVGGGTAYAAESAVPGDLLYSVKVNVNEPVRATLAVSPEGRASWHREAAERRMKEAQILAARGTLTAEIKDELEENFDTHATEVETIVGAVEKEDPVVAADISSRFGSSIEAHSAVIARLSEEGGNEENRRESEHLAQAFKKRGAKIVRAERAGVSIEGRMRESIKPALHASARSATTTIVSVVVSDSSGAVSARIEKNTSTTLEEIENAFSELKGKLGTSTSARTEAQIERLRGRLGKLKKERDEGRSEKGGVERAFQDAVIIKTFLEAQEKFKELELLPAPEVDDNNHEDKGKDENKSKGNNDDRNDQSADEKSL